jgi:hypothetical protein
MSSEITIRACDPRRLPDIRFGGSAPFFRARSIVIFRVPANTAGMEIELSATLGRKVDLRTPGELSAYFRNEVVGAAIPQYER